MNNIDVSLPPKIYRYSMRSHAERCLRLGEFRLVPASHYLVLEGGTVLNAAAQRDYLVVCFSDCLSDSLFDDFGGADACLMINNVPVFSERFHASVQAALPNWHGIEARLSYGKPSRLGPAFSKPAQFAGQREFRFVWQPGTPVKHVEPVIVTMGNIADIAEIVDRPKRDIVDAKGSDSSTR